MEIILQFFTALLVVIIIWSVVKWINAKTHLPPGMRFPPTFVPSVPVLGSFPFLPKDPTEFPRFYMQQAAKHGNVLALYMGSKYAIVLNGAEAISEALLKKSGHFADRGQSLVVDAMTVQDKGIEFINYTEVFRRKHKLFLSILKQLGYGSRSMETRIHVEVEELVKQIKMLGGKSSDPSDIIHMCVLNVLASMMFGRRYPYGDPKLIKLRQTMQNALDSITYIVDTVPFLRFVPHFRGMLKRVSECNAIVINFLDQEVNAVLRYADNLNSNDSFVKLFVELTSTGLNKTSLTDSDFDRLDLLYTLRDLIGAGEDTISTTLRWVLINLANNPEVQIRLQKEVDDTVGRVRMCSLEDEVNMPYTQAFILETMRHDTAAPLGVFHETSCDTSVGSYFIPANTTVVTNLYSAHMDPTEWHEPEVFKPERFLDEHGQLTGKNRVISFSLGKRACIGELLARQELFLFVTGIAQNFDILPPEGLSEVAYSTKLTLVWQPLEFSVRLMARKS